GRIGKIARRLSSEPPSTPAWKEGALGEERVAVILADRLGNQAVLLHDRRVPGTRGNIDHVVVASSGVWVVDAKRYSGKVERRDVGGFFRKDLRLYVDGRDRTRLLDGVRRQVDAVRSVLGSENVAV